jgi:hypothetical protein
VVHETASDNQDPNKTARYHITPSPDNSLCKSGAAGIAYTDYITKEGLIYHCNFYTDVTWHASLYNTRSIGVGMAYKSMDKQGREVYAPTDEQFLALEEHLTAMCLNLKILPQGIIGHREVPGMFTIVGKGLKKYKKTCPGLLVDLNKLRLNIAYRVQTVLASEGLHDGRLDGIFGPEWIGALASRQEMSGMPLGDNEETSWLWPANWVSSIDR